MMGIGWGEMLFIGIVAVMVLEPRDIPVFLRTLGRISAKVRALSSDLTQALDTITQEAGEPHTHAPPLPNTIPHQAPPEQEPQALRSDPPPHPHPTHTRSAARITAAPQDEAIPAQYPPAGACPIPPTRRHIKAVRRTDHASGR